MFVLLSGNIRWFFFLFCLLFIDLRPRIDNFNLFFFSFYLQSIARSVGCQIMSEEILASCSGGPRGNEQLSDWVQLFFSLKILFFSSIITITKGITTFLLVFIWHNYVCMHRYAAVFAALVSGLASLVGIDFGAKLLASLAKCFEVHCCFWEIYFYKKSNLALYGVCIMNLVLLQMATNTNNLYIF